MKRGVTMTGDHQSDFSKKQSESKMIDPAIEIEVNRLKKDGELPCALAFEIAEKTSVNPEDVGKALDLMNIRITKCQLGLFGYKPNKKIVKPLDSVDQELAKEIKNVLVNNRVSCENLWAIAFRLDIRKMTISSACESLGIKIKPCQLGAF